MVVTVRIPSLRSLGLVLAGLLLGLLLVAPVVARGTDAAVRSSGTVAGHATCVGLDFYPAYNGPTFGNQGTIRWAYGSDSGVRLRCGLDLPHGATIRAVRFTVYDSDETGNVKNCFVGRADLDPPAATHDQLTDVMQTSGMPGATLLVDTTVSFPVVDNRHHAYWAECEAGLGLYPNGGIIGVTLKYTMPV